MARLARVGLAQNSAKSGGGGVYVYGGAALALADSVLEANTAPKYSGGVFAGTGATLTLRNATLRRNAPQGLYCSRKAGGDATLSDGTFPAPGGPAAYACDK